ncbi:MAG: glycine cleavage system protein GcvH [Anabaena sp. CoA2_C59]|jgi:glycine cleavage system H protein|uniref:Glycine cleavage system H protein n=2 Tax=Aphanizomenon flos-aquae TaxID=1176 RepID=A0ABR8IRN9_APHFL|nr:MULTISPECIES: glycine cleavage system protein GcvH [Aphanizomenon]MBD1217082.1 glycine cleavage system protein GcvH [Aphanizomenon flos-aquae Clear-A1]MCE2903426.1 glycine cleavage system protein GcvH [Anabaena sp. CoA2_C59]MDJ0506304.1 glycine cleavage system protein GcvH [Nostocales cyanobacterium LE14-WE12]OBQ28122.1 MAG: glycine cleavage system protein H [Aphanizomenon flos-aquae MDT14a]MBD2390520.1 glycine cleavage system protein GcvH [Aphanizomenon flos-aquae FACHB-1171]
MSFEYPQDLRYLDSHEYVRVDGEIATIGITSFAIDQLGDIVFLELSDISEVITKGDSFGSIESVKAVEDLKSPITGTVVERNEALINNPEQVAEDPYGEGWFLKVRINDPDEANEDTLTADEYSGQVEGM